ncbi:MauE/DoxX family redox-associated membrane protein [Egicoccus halophilus]|uniref:Methylamine utilisation protein MauE domain-containing protein n=1 Tax=Egicoccus halophilus TaxID=1670830 RepID=A0A8J3AAR0_9ACTN|nr:MauE/DoxX family redox-associated membrane protein [Egicoccus halophilus]GGI09058.1 hypothetical protein GCM10011354_32180 [Egicoccus halophilus]
MYAVLEAWSPLAAELLLVAVVLGAGLLLPAGLAKLRRPQDAGDALGWRGARARLLVRTIGAGELGLAVLVLVVGGRLPLVGLALAYGAFTLVAARQWRRGASCGCFGQAAAPAGPLHVTIDAVVTVAAAVAALAPNLALLGSPAAGLGLAALPTLVAAVLALVAVASLQQLLGALPDLRAATRRITLPAPRVAPSDPGAGGRA